MEIPPPLLGGGYVSIKLLPESILRHIFDTADLKTKFTQAIQQSQMTNGGRVAYNGPGTCCQDNKISNNTTVPINDFWNYGKQDVAKANKSTGSVSHSFIPVINCQE